MLVMVRLRETSLVQRYDLIVRSLPSATPHNVEEEGNGKSVFNVGVKDAMAVDLKGHLAAEREECLKEGILPTLRHICEIQLPSRPLNALLPMDRRNSRFGRGNNLCTVLKFLMVVDTI